jgi:hypothetical protein
MRKDWCTDVTFSAAEFVAHLTSSHEIPAGSVVSSASGYAFFKFDPVSRTVWRC